MGYRDDDVAQNSRLELLQREMSSIELELETLRQEAQQLRHTVSRRRLRIALNRVGQWISRHPKTAVLLFVVIGTVLALVIKSRIEAQRRQERLQRVVGRNCTTTLEVNASHWARLLINGLMVGQVPQSLPICPGRYRLQLVHDRALPWQQVVRVRPGQPRLKLDVPMVPFRPSQRPRDGVVVFSTPPGALLFANGEELGHTPLLIQRAQLSKKLLLGLWSGQGTQIWSGPSRPAALWFHLGPPRAAVVPRAKANQ